ncbi:hypothetical protein LR48_Vigan04g156000 [Vigna angularis]|uniref:GRF-type domain-containing protein n=1 Tax=Phaseolus angularis TaxID=3914 RepID=A0A0L9UFK7_PHAAN|nr:hypothetical protein LR48_Vigan04g156000 [Vigna angularis]
MSKDHSCGWRKKNPSVCFRGGRGSRCLDDSPICHYGQKYVLRTMKTTKNRDKQFWSCSKYKNDTEDVGCNYFRWSTDVGFEERGT